MKNSSGISKNPTRFLEMPLYNIPAKKFYGTDLYCRYSREHKEMVLIRGNATGCNMEKYIRLPETFLNK